MKTVKVDFNMITDDGLVPASPSFASDELHTGDRVEAIDFADPDMSFIGVVEDIDDKGFAYLRMEWEDNTPVPSNKPGLNLFVASWSEAPITAQPLRETSGEGVPVSPPQASPPLVASAHPMSA